MQNEPLIPGYGSVRREGALCLMAVESEGCLRQSVARALSESSSSAAICCAAGYQLRYTYSVLNLAPLGKKSASIVGPDIGPSMKLACLFTAFQA